MTQIPEETGSGIAATLPEDELKAKLVLETATMPWSELQRFFARGQVVRAAPELDLIEAAMAVARDDRDQVQLWLERGLFGEVSTAQAQAWFEAEARLWTVVVAPWVLVQEGSEARPLDSADRPRH